MKFVFKFFIIGLLLVGLSACASATLQPWNVTITATNQLEPVTFGYHPDASDGYDQFDEFTQTPIQGKVIMSLDTIYAKCIKRDNLIWNLSVGVPTGQTTTLTWDTSNVPENVKLEMYNDTINIDMKIQNSLSLGEGAHEFTIKATVTEVDKTPPILTFVDPTPDNNSSVNQKFVLINVTSNEPLSKAFIHIQVWNGTAWVDDKGNIGEIVLPMNNTTDTIWWFNLTPPTDVILRYWVNGSDLAGNNNKTEVRYLKISGYPPEIFVATPTKIPQNATVNMTVAIYDATPSTYKILKNGSLIKQGTYEPFQLFNVSIDTSQVGTWNYTIWANDSFNNINQTSIIIEIYNPLIWEGTVNLTPGNFTIEINGKTYEVSNTSALGALHYTGLSYEVSDEWYEQYGSLFVTSIANISASGTKGWLYWVNYPNEPIPMVGANQYELKDGDTVYWYYGGWSATPDNAEYLIIIHVKIKAKPALIPEIIAPEITVKPLDIVKIPIYINNVTNATGAGFKLIFDPEVIRVVEVKPNTTYFTNISVPIDYNINNTTGFVNVARILLDPATTTQPQPIIDIIARVVANKTFTYLNFTFAEVSLSDFNVTDVITINGSVTVVGLKGDLNDNGRIDIGDVAKVGYMVVGKVQYDPKADFNQNNQVDITDLAKIASYYVGKISKL